MILLPLLSRAHWTEKYDPDITFLNDYRFHQRSLENNWLGKLYSQMWKMSAILCHQDLYILLEILEIWRKHSNVLEVGLWYTFSKAWRPTNPPRSSFWNANYRDQELLSEMNTFSFCLPPTLKIMFTSEEIISEAGTDLKPPKSLWHDYGTKQWQIEDLETDCRGKW